MFRILLCLFLLSPTLVFARGGSLYQRPQTQIFYNIISDGGAQCNGDSQVQTLTVSTTNGSPAVSVTTNAFAAGDVGKYIIIPNAGFGGNTYLGNIASFTDAQHITVTPTPQGTVASVSEQIAWGTDDAPAFATFNSWARTNQGSSQVVLTVPSGAVCWFGSPNSISGTSLQNAWAAGIKNLLVDGYGATLTSHGGTGFFLGGQGIIQIGLTAASGKSARINSASAGALTVQLTSTSFGAGYISRFTVGDSVMFGGINPQADWNSPFGFPPNFAVFEWRKITAIDTGTGIITLDKALDNTYLDTWPTQNDGDNFEVDQGGPATIYDLGSTWDVTGEYQGLTIYQDGQTYAGSRNVTFKNTTFLGGNCIVPTQNETWTVDSSDLTGCDIEVDKLIGTMTINSVTLNQLVFQSSSTNHLVINNSNITSFLNGNATKTDITDTTIQNYQPGPYAYGASVGGYINCTRCNIATMGWVGGLEQPGTDYTMTSGVLQFLNTNQSGSGPDQRPFVPNGNLYYSGTLTGPCQGSTCTIGLFTVGSFQGQAQTQDATNVYVQTNQAGGFPAVNSGTLNIRTVGAPNFTCTDCTGDPTLVAASSQSGAPANIPLAQYSQSTYTASAAGFLGDNIVIGNLVSLEINVTQAYTGSGSMQLLIGQFHNFNAQQSNWTLYDWNPAINLNVAGDRVITPTGTTCNGVAGPCSGDSCVEPVLGGIGCYSLPEPIWMTDGIEPWVVNSPSGGTNAVVTITIKTDQHLQ